ncbi:MAG TPA: ABC transporter substrate-binding protein [Polyangiaceae bacterium]|jgi:phospholipid transport system substrate-binding protein|nr:ABC transporter substrate-binding protein [Polyangiaceae bacterium]
MFKRSFRAAALVAALVFAAPLAQAAEAENFVKGKQTELTELVRKAKTPADEKRIETAFDDVLDYETLARESLKDSWGDLKAEERSEFQDVLKRLVRATYRRNLKRIKDYEVGYNGESKVELGQIVRTVAKSRSNAREEPVSIDYVVREAGGKWRIVDIVTEGSSLVGNYRNQFRRIIKKQGFPELIRRMKTRAEKGGAD